MAENFDDKNIILTGFMGTGKSTIGRMLAEHLNRPFIDMDEQIEANFGKKIAEIFANEGEASFRIAESQLCAAVAQKSGIVLSTGGGALVNPQNRQTLAESGIIVCLTATVDTILERVEETSERPLLPGTRDQQRQRIRQLLHERRHAYAAIQHQVDTSRLPPQEIVQEIVETLTGDREVEGMSRISVQGADGTYDICIGDELLNHAGMLLKNRGLRQGPVAIVTNEDVAAHYAAPLIASLTAAGYEATLCTVPEGEGHKTLATISDLYEQFLAARLDRNSAVLSLGGGVVGDMAGFAAASYLRGVPFVQVPTSLLAMVDASVGGKTGVDLPQGKNLVGAFKQPSLVIIDTAVMSTLPAREYRAGLAEIIKHGIIDAPDLFCQLEEHGPTSMKQLIADAVRVKVRVVEEDPFEQGRRAVLNLGHTFGHAIELVTHFKVGHGEGVALGLVAAANMAVELERCSPNLRDRIVNLVERLGLPVSLKGHDPDEIIDAMGTDKKRAGKTLRFIIPQKLGDVVIINDPGRAIVRRAVESIIQPGD